MTNFWRPQFNRAKIILKHLKDGKTIDFGSAGMRDDGGKESLHQNLMDNHNGGIIGVDIRPSDYTDVIADLDKPLDMFANDSITNITAGEVMEHLKRPYEFLKECHRILERGGRLVLTTPSAEGVQLLMGRESPYHYFTWTEKNLKYFCSSVGFKIIHSQKLNIYYNRNLFLRGFGYVFYKFRPTLLIVLEK